MNSKKNKGKAKLPEPPVITGIDSSGGTMAPEISPDEIPARLREDLCRWKRDINKHREHFMAKGISPFQEALEIPLSSKQFL